MYHQSVGGPGALVVAIRFVALCEFELFFGVFLDLDITQISRVKALTLPIDNWGGGAVGERE
jgi:hypothetical protein